MTAYIPDMLYHPLRPKTAHVRAALLAAAVLVGQSPQVSAQYDRDGRYVPSPNGIPSDPSARTIPLYSGAPGEANGTPSLPRSMNLPPPKLPPMDRPPTAAQRPATVYVRPAAKKPSCDDDGAKAKANASRRSKTACKKPPG